MTTSAPPSTVPIHDRVSALLEPFEALPSPTENAESNPSCQPLPNPCQEPVLDGFLKRAATAVLLGVSEATLRRRYEGKDLAVHKDPKGTHYFNPSQVESLALRLRVETKSTTRTLQTLSHEHPVHDKLAAEVFTAFRQGTKPVDVVCTLRLSPLYVERLYGQWMRMRSGLELTPEMVQVARDKYFLHLEHGMSKKDFLRACDSAFSWGCLCQACRGNEAQYCASCVPLVIKRAEQQEKKARASTKRKEQKDTLRLKLKDKEDQRQWESAERHRDRQERERERQRETEQKHTEQIADMLENMRNENHQKEKESSRLSALNKELKIRRNDDYERKSLGIDPLSLKNAKRENRRR